MTTRQELAELAHRIEAAEAAACQAKLAARQASVGAKRPVEIARMGSTILFSSRQSRRDSAYNRALAFSSADKEHLDDVLQWLREREVYFFDVAPVMAGDQALQALVDEGFHIATVSNVLTRVPDEMEDSPAPGVEVRAIDLADAGQVEDYGVALYRGFKVPKLIAEAGLRSKRVELSAPGWRIYLAYLEGKPAALANLYLAGGVAVIDELADVPQFRGRGCRAALLKRCITEAVRAGCELIAGRTNPESDLEQVMVSVGFEVVYEKRLYSRESRAHYDQ